MTELVTPTPLDDEEADAGEEAPVEGPRTYVHVSSSAMPRTAVDVTELFSRGRDVSLRDVFGKMGTVPGSEAQSFVNGVLVTGLDHVVRPDDQIDVSGKLAGG